MASGRSDSMHNVTSDSRCAQMSFQDVIVGEALSQRCYEVWGERLRYHFSAEKNLKGAKYEDVAKKIRLSDVSIWIRKTEIFLLKK